MATNDKPASGKPPAASDTGQTWKPAPGTEQDTHLQTPGGGEEAKHGTKDPAETNTAHSATRKGEQ